MKSSDMLYEVGEFEQLQRVANMFAKSKMIPEHLRGNVADVAICLYSAKMLGVDPLLYMQGSYVVHGKVGIMGQLAITLLNVSGVLKGGVHYEFNKEKTECVAWGIRSDTGARVESSVVSVALAQKMGWMKNQGWISNPELMMRYRSATYLVRTNFPEVLSGMRTVDELEDSSVQEPPMKFVNPPHDPDTKKSPFEKLKNKLVKGDLIIDSPVSKPKKTAEELMLMIPTSFNPDGDIYKRCLDSISWAMSDREILRDTFIKVSLENSLLDSKSFDYENYSQFLLDLMMAIHS